MARKTFTTQVTMTGRRICGGVAYGPGDTPILAESIAQHWIGLGVAIPYVETAPEQPEAPAQAPEIAPAEAIEPEAAAEATQEAKP